MCGSVLPFWFNGGYLHLGQAVLCLGGLGRFFWFLDRQFNKLRDQWASQGKVSPHPTTWCWYFRQFLCLPFLQNPVFLWCIITGVNSGIHYQPYQLVTNNIILHGHPSQACAGHEDGHLTEPCITPLVRCGGLLCLHGIFHLQGSGDLFLGMSCHFSQFGDGFGGLIGRNEAIDLHRSPAAPMVRWIWEPSGTTKLLRFLCRFSECFLHGLVKTRRSCRCCRKT